MTRSVILFAALSATPAAQAGIPGASAPAAVTLAPCRPCPNDSAPDPGRVAVEFVPAGAWVNVDLNGERVLDYQMGRFWLALAPGEHLLRFTNDAAEPSTLWVRVGADQRPGRVVVRLRPLPAEIVISGAPDGSLLRVADRRVLLRRSAPRAVLVPLEAAHQNYVVEVLGPSGRVLLHQTITFRPGRQTTLAVDAKP
jgi:hypothetical protein